VGVRRTMAVMQVFIGMAVIMKVFVSMAMFMIVGMAVFMRMQVPVMFMGMAVGVVITLDFGFALAAAADCTHDLASVDIYSTSSSLTRITSPPVTETPKPPQ
jgi:hypothetical protein